MIAERQHGVVTAAQLRQAGLAQYRAPHLSATKRTRWDLEYHRGSVAFEDDHARDLELRAHGIVVRRYTGEQLEAAPEAVVGDLREALGLAS